MMCNPDPDQSKVLPFKINDDINFAGETPDETILEHDHNLVMPVATDRPDAQESASYDDQVANFARDLWLGDRKTTEQAVVKRKTYYA